MIFKQRQNYGDSKKEKSQWLPGMSQGEMNKQSAEDFRTVKVLCTYRNGGYLPLYICPDL